MARSNEAEKILPQKLEILIKLMFDKFTTSQSFKIEGQLSEDIEHFYCKHVDIQRILTLDSGEISELRLFNQGLAILKNRCNSLLKKVLIDFLYYLKNTFEIFTLILQCGFDKSDILDRLQKIFDVFKTERMDDELLCTDFNPDRIEYLEKILNFYLSDYEVSKDIIYFSKTFQ